MITDLVLPSASCSSPASPVHNSHTFNVKPSTRRLTLYKAVHRHLNKTDLMFGLRPGNPNDSLASIGLMEGSVVLVADANEVDIHHS